MTPFAQIPTKGVIPLKPCKQLLIHSETVYILGILLLSLAVAMTAAAGFGVSMIVAPAYIVSEKLPLSFGQSEYLLQAILFVLFCLLMKRVRLVYFASFATCAIYGAVLDLWRTIIPLLNPAVTPPGSMCMPARILLFVGGMLLTSFSVALFFHTYLYPQVYDFFVKGISRRFGMPLAKFKTGFDATCLLVSGMLSLVLFRRFVGLGVGTLIMTAVNGTLIGKFDALFQKRLCATPRLKKFATHFTL